MKSGDLVQDRYIIQDFLGEGNIGAVYSCKDKVLKAKYAIKVLKASSKEKALARFHSEAKTIAKLNHDNIVKVFDFGQTASGDAYMVLEFCKGESLDKRLAKGDSFSLLDTTSLLVTLASALEHAHNKGIIHRDIKPSNIFFKEEPTGAVTPKILDFGIAKIESEELYLTQEKSLVGSPRYMSPEAINASDIDKRSDIYSLGCIAFELYANSLPFDNMSSIEILQFKAKNKFPKLSSFSKKEIPPCIDEFVARCLECEKEKRYKNVSKALHDLENCVAILNGDTVVPLSPNSTRAENPKRKIKKLALIIPVLLVGLGYFAFSSVFVNQEKKKTAAPKPNQQEILKYKPQDLFNKLEKKRIMREERKGKTWYRYTGVNETKDLKYLVGKRAGNTEIRRLRLPQDDLVGKGISNIKSLNLIALDLVQSAVDKSTMNELSKFDSLEELSLRLVNRISDEDLKDFANLKKLTKLDLSSTDITDGAFKYLAKIPSLEEISFDGCKKVTGESILQLSNIRVLDLINSGFRPERTKDLARLSNLKFLYLSGLNLKNSDLKPLAKLKLRKIVLDENVELTDDCFETLAKMSELQEVSINKVKNITWKAEKDFRRLRPKIKLQVLRSGDAQMEHKHELDFIRDHPVQ